MRRTATTLVLALSLTGFSVFAQEAQSLDGPQRPFQDPFFDRLTGYWTMTGSVGQRAVTYSLRVEWKVFGQWSLRRP